MWQWHEDWLAREHQKALLEEAERRHLLRIVQGTRPAAHIYYGPALVWVGRQMADWGVRLQKRYTPLGLCADLPDA